MRFEQSPQNFTDWSGLHKLLTESFAYMDGIIDPPSSLHNLTSDDLRQKAKKEILTLVWDAENLVACGYFDIQADLIYIGKIAVANAHQKRGIAKQIIDHAVDLAKQNNKPWLELKTRIELTDNHQAFGKMGFVKTGEHSHQGYSRPTFITMRKNVQRKI